MASSCRWTAASRHIPACKSKIELHKSRRGSPAAFSAFVSRFLHGMLWQERGERAILVLRNTGREVAKERMKQYKGVFLLAAGAAVVLAAVLLFGRARPAQDPPLTAESVAQKLGSETVGQLLEELKRSDGAYTEDCFAALAQRLLEKPEDTLGLLQEDPQMQEAEFAALVLEGLGRELYYRPEEEAKAALREYLQSLPPEQPLGELAAPILTRWDEEGAAP